MREVFNGFVKKFRSVYNCHKEVLVDEAMIPFKGKLKIKVRMADKPIKFGVKLFQVCDARNGYCKNIKIYTCQDDHASGNIGNTGKIYFF